MDNPADSPPFLNFFLSVGKWAFFSYVYPLVQISSNALGIFLKDKE